MYTLYKQDSFIVNNKTNTEQIVQAKYSAYLKMLSAFADMEDAVPHFSSSAASQKAKFSPDKNSQLNNIHSNLFMSKMCEHWVWFNLCSPIHIINIRKQRNLN